MEYRSDQSHSEYDFVLHYPNGTTAAVEVTESADQLQKQTSAEIRNKKKGGPVVEAQKCQKSWHIFPMANANISKIREKVDEYLSLLEQAEIERFDFLEAATSRSCKKAGIEKSLIHPVPECVENICYDLQIRFGAAVDSRGSPEIYIHHPVRGGAVGSSVAIEAGEREAVKDDNRKKRGAANAGERHLVVYVDVTNSSPWVALTEFEPPPAVPKIPAEITHIWLIGHSGTSNDEFVVWRASTQDPWHSQRVVIPQDERIAS